MSDEQENKIFPDSNDSTETIQEVEEEKPRRRRGRPRKNVVLKEEVGEKKEPVLDGKVLGEATANLLNSIASNLPEKWFEKRELSDIERNVTIESVSAIAATVEQEKVSKFARTLPYVAVTIVVGAIFLSRLKKHEAPTEQAT